MRGLMQSLAIHCLALLWLCAADAGAQSCALWQQRVIGGTVPSARSHSSFGFDPTRGAVVLFGGQTGGLADTWEFNGTSWTQFTSAAPPGRSRGAMAYDSLRGRLVLFGGQNANQSGGFNDTWARTGTTWAQLNQAGDPAPSARYTNMVYDAARDRMVIFGGVSALNPLGAPLADTWEFNGTSWTQITTTQTPPGRYGYGLSYDSNRQRVVLFGGVNNGGTSYLNDTWEYDGLNWVNVSPAANNPPGRAGIASAMPFDALRGRVILFGGVTTGSVSLNDTWEWDGTAWTQIATTGTPPSPRTGPNVAFDSARQRLVLFGGFTGGTTFNAETWEYSGDAPAVISNPTGGTFTSGQTVGLAFETSAIVVGSIQWRKNGIALADGGRVSGATSRQLSIASVTPDDSGVYDAVASNPCGAATTTGATVSIYDTPSVVAPPSSLTAIVGQQVEFGAIVGGSQPLTLRWQRNGVDLIGDNRISGIDTPTLTIDPVTSADAGSYALVASNPVGSVVTPSATLTVLVPPAITTHPAPQMVLEGRPVSLSVVASGTAPLAYQWRRGTTALEDSDRVSGSGTSTLSISSAIASDAGQYDVLVSNSAGQASGGPVAVQVGVAGLAVSGVAAPSVLTVGVPFQVSWVDSNPGSLPASAAWSDRVTYSTNDVLGDADDVILGQVNSGPIAGGVSLPRSLTVTVPVSVALGSGRIFVSSDPNQQVFVNDRSQAASSLAGISLGSPHLVVESVATPESLGFGQTITVTWTERNIGDRLAPAHSAQVVLSANSVFGDSDDVSLASPSLPALNAGQAAVRQTSVTMPANQPEGTYRVLVRSDATSQVPHSSRAGNTGSGPQLVLSAPDLQITTLTPPPSVRPNTSVELAWTITNTGTIPAVGPWVECISGSNGAASIGLGSFNVPAGFTLMPGQSLQRVTSVGVPAVPPGNYTVTVCADCNGQVPELVENNNCRTSPVCVDCLSPDLVPVSVAATSAVRSGVPIDLSWQVRNGGQGAASGSWVDRVYLSANQTFEPDIDSILLTESISGPVGSTLTYTRSAIGTVPVLPDGPYFLILVTDGNNGVSEPGGESNNVFVTATPVQLLAPPELAISTLGGVPPALVFGDSFVLNYTVSNQGGTAAGQFTDAIYLSTDSSLGAGDVLLSSLSSPTQLAPGEVYQRATTVALPVDLSASGPRFVIVRIDDANAIRERNDANNVAASTPIETTPTPAVDLTVGSVVAPSSATFGSPISVSWVVSNQGQASAVSPWSDSAVLSINEMFGDNDDIPLAPAVPGQTPLGSGASYTRTNVQFSTPNRYLPGAAYRVLVRTGDPTNIAPRELNRSNNVAASAPIAFSPTPSPNLIVTEVDAPVEAVAGGSVQLRWRVQNVGSAPLTGSWIDRVTLIDPAMIAPEIELGVFSHFGPGDYQQQQVVNLPADIEGVRQFAVTTDAGNAIAEPAPGAEADNSRTETSFTQITLPSGPDLIVVSVNPSSSQSTFGESFSLAVTVRNIGTATTNGTWADRVLLRREGTPASQDLPLDPVVVAPGQLAPQQQYTSIFTVTPPIRNEFTNGTYRFIGRTDANGTVAEQRESNNQGISSAVQLTRPDLPNLRVASVSVPPPGLPGGPAEISWSVTNVGGVAASAGWVEQLFLSPDNQVGGDTLVVTVQTSEALEPGQTSAVRTRTVPIPLSGTAYRAVVCIDPTGAVVETDESDNCGISPSDSTIRRPDLVVNDIAATPSTVQADGSITVTWNGVNQGQAPTASTFVDLVSLIDVTTGARHVLGSRIQQTQVGSGSSDPRSESFLVPGRIRGTFVVQVVTDTASNIVESNEANNSSVSVSTVNVEQPGRANLIVDSVQQPTGGLVGGAATVSWVVRNASASAATGTWFDRVTLRNLATGTEATFAVAAREGGLPAGQTYSASASINLPQVPGDYLVCVYSDSGDSVNEGLDGGESDNRTCAPSAVRAEGYIVSITPSINEATAGSPVSVTGSATLPSTGQPLPNQPVEFSVAVRGTTRVYPPGTLRTDSNGNYQFLLPLVPGEAGQYALKAGPPGAIGTSVQSSFILHGLRATRTITLPRIVPGAPPTLRRIEVTNTGDLPLQGLAMSIVESPPGLEIQGGPDSSPLLGQQTRGFDLAFSASSGATASSGPVRLRFATAQGAIAETSFDAQVAPADPRLEVLESTPISSPMLVAGPGETLIQTNVQFRIVNSGGQPTGPISVQIPAAPWLALSSPATLPALAPGEQAAVVLTLTPGRNLLTADPVYPGTITLNSAAPQLVVPFRFTAVPSSTGGLVVLAENEATFYDANPSDPFPRVRGAFARLTRPDNNTVIASGLTGPDGAVTFDGIPEGDYNLEVSASRHQPFRRLVAIRAGAPQSVFAFLSFNAVSYTWRVDPIQIEDRYRFVLDVVFETNVPYPVVDIEPRVIDLDDFADGQPHQINFTLTNRGIVRAEDVELILADSADWTITAINTQVGNLGPQQSVTIPAVLQRRAPCENCGFGSGCAPPSTRARQVVRCREDQPLEQSVAYRLEPCGSPTGLVGGPIPTIVVPPGTASPVVRTPSSSPVNQEQPCAKCIKVAAFYFSGGCGSDSASITANGALAGLFRDLGKLQPCVKAFDVSGVRCPERARELAAQQIALIVEYNRQNNCCIEAPLVMTVGTSWGGETALNPVGIGNVREIVVIDGINHRTAMGGVNQFDPICQGLAGLFACINNVGCADLLPELGTNPDGSGSCGFGLDQRGCTIAPPAAAAGARIQNIRAGIADSCGPNSIAEYCYGSLSRGFNISGVSAVEVPTASHCTITGTSEVAVAIRNAIDSLFAEVPICPLESPPCPTR